MFSVDVAITAAVLYPVGSLGRTIKFTTSVGFTEKEMYYVTMDPGDKAIVVKPTAKLLVNVLLLNNQDV